jgi:hypothetical protein
MTKRVSDYVARKIKPRDGFRFARKKHIARFISRVAPNGGNSTHPTEPIGFRESLH